LPHSISGREMDVVGVLRRELESSDGSENPRPQERERVEAPSKSPVPPPICSRIESESIEPKTLTTSSITPFFPTPSHPSLSLLSPLRFRIIPLSLAKLETGRIHVGPLRWR
jgi:hypothetical protein